MNRMSLSTLNQMTFAAIMAALQMVILLFHEWLPIIGYWFTFLLPFITLSVVLVTKIRIFIAYIATTMVLIFLVMIAPLETLAFFWFPSLALGIGYGVAIRHKFSYFSLVLTLSFIQYGVLMLIRTWSIFFYEADMLTFLYQLLNVADRANIGLLDPLMLFAFALTQVLMSLLMLMPLIERWSFPISYHFAMNTKQIILFGILLGFALLLTILMPQLALYLLGPLTLLSMYAMVYFFFKPFRFAPYILLASLFVYPFINAAFSGVLDGPYRILSILFLGIVPFILLLIKSVAQTSQNALR